MQAIRFEERFRYFGGGLSDVQWAGSFAIQTKLFEELDYLEEANVYLGRYAHFSPEFIDTLELPVLDRYVVRTRKWIYAERGRDQHGKPVVSSDNPSEPL